MKKPGWRDFNGCHRWKRVKQVRRVAAATFDLAPMQVDSLRPGKDLRRRATGRDRGGFRVLADANACECNISAKLDEFGEIS
jgi:hypothetical protein